MLPTAKTNCQLADCRRAASAYCYCCKRNACTHHFLEHIERMKAKIDPLANEVNNTMESIQHLTVDQLSRPIFAQLNEWQKNMHEMIDEIHEKKKKEIEEMVKMNATKFDEHRRAQLETMMKLQDAVQQVAEDGDVTLEQIESFDTQLRAIGNSLAVFEKNFLSMNTRVLPDGLVIVSSKLNEPIQPVNQAQTRYYVPSQPSPAAAPMSPFSEPKKASKPSPGMPMNNPRGHSPHIPPVSVANPSAGPFSFGAAPGGFGITPTTTASSMFGAPSGNVRK